MNARARGGARVSLPRAWWLVCGVGLACEGAPEETEVLPLTDIEQPPGFALTVFETSPPGNELTEARAQLGKRLFFDPVLSRDRTIACSSCHHQDHGFADPRPVSEGVFGRVGVRNASHLANLAWVETGLFWDGRASSLEEQVGKPIEDPVEMDLTLSEAVARLGNDSTYIAAFQSAYGSPPTEETLRMALASFVRTLVSSDSRYDRFLAGDVSALDEAEQRGLAIFFDGRSGCFHCHSENTLTNDGYFNNGLFVEGGDVGRQAWSGRTGDLGKFRVPNLRNVAVTAPYMHDGSIPTLRAVVDHYVRGGLGHPSTDAQIEPLTLGEDEKTELVAFLETLTDERFLSDRRFEP